MLRSQLATNIIIIMASSLCDSEKAEKKFNHFFFFNNSNYNRRIYAQCMKTFNEHKNGPKVGHTACSGRCVCGVRRNESIFTRRLSRSNESFAREKRHK